MCAVCQDGSCHCTGTTAAQSAEAMVTSVGMVEFPTLSEIPRSPGCYLFEDSDGRVLYVGKAGDLRSRLAAYSQRSADLPFRTHQMLERASRVRWIEVATEVEALLLENNLIKQHQPPFNIRLRDDKSYPYLALTMRDEWPRAVVVRGRRRRGNRYFGPYGHAWAIRETLDVLVRVFPVRTCSDGVFRVQRQMQRPCLLYDVGKCSGPCVGLVDANTYMKLVEGLSRVLEGRSDEVMANLEREMSEAAARLEFERAAVTRDRLAALRRVLEGQQVVLGSAVSLDVFGVASDELFVAVEVLSVRSGRLVGSKSSVTERVEALEGAELVGRLVSDHYASDPAAGVPAKILVPEEPSGRDAAEEWLSGLKGAPVRVVVPREGAGRQLLTMATENARTALERHKARRGSDHTTRTRAMEELQLHLHMPNPPLRIECFDMSHLHGTDYVGSMVVLEDGLPRKSQYRRFRIRGVEGIDDVAAMAEVVRRRLVALLEERSKPVRERSPRFAYPPQLLLVDGGKPQLGAAAAVVEELGLSGEITVAALAKRLEEVFVPGRRDPVAIPRGSEALFLLQRARDEAHRFALDHHRRLRSRRMRDSTLEGVKGLGPKRRERLLRELGGIEGVRRASRQRLLSLSWLPDEVGERVWSALHRAGADESGSDGSVGEE